MLSTLFLREIYTGTENSLKQAGLNERGLPSCPVRSAVGRTVLPQHPDAQAPTPHVAWAVAFGADEQEAGHQWTGVLARRRRDTRDVSVSPRAHRGRPRGGQQEGSRDSH